MTDKVIDMKNIPYEIERKYLIRYPDLDWLEKAADKSEITQTYLHAADGVTARVRKRMWKSKCVYTHTVKQKISDLRRIEHESEISEAEYNRLLKKADPRRNTIRKARYCLPYEGQLFEIDVFPFWQDRAYLEIELKNEDQSICFPPEIELIREVTEDPRYTNAALSLHIPMDDIDP